MSRAGVAGLAALAAVNAVLIPIALHTDQGVADAPRGSGTPGPDGPADGTAAFITPLGTRPAIDHVGDALVLDVIPGLAVLAPAGPALRAPAAPAIGAPAGTCGDGGSELRLSRDGGGTWQTVLVPASAVLRVLIADPQRIWLVGADRDCRARLHHTLDGGATWRSWESTAGTWHPLADPAPTQIHAPRGRIPAPCQRVVEVVAVSGSTAAARCQDGSVHQTDDSGRTWHVAGRSAVRALAFADVRTLYAVHAGTEGCAGLQVSRQSAHGWDRVGCVADAAAPLPVALSFVDANAGLLVSGTRTYATSDGGRTWQRRDTWAPRRDAAVIPR
jgi:hypothetical protein